LSKLYIIGAGGHAKVVGEIAELNGYNNLVFTDNLWPDKKNCEHWKVESSTKNFQNQTLDTFEYFVAIGDNHQRMSVIKEMESTNGKLITLFHPSAFVSKYSSIGPGTIVMANATINPFCNVGSGCIINTNASIDHDCAIETGVHISPGAHLAGHVSVSFNAWIGLGASIIQHCKIGNNAIVGAGSTVINNVLDSTKVVGSPARELKK
jgi:sugar O-acyltransferase (sialic acid O-acetyltransferase NeuD family)